MYPLNCRSIPFQWIKVMNSATIDEAHLTDILDASDWLLSMLAKMEPPTLPAAFMNMRAVSRGMVERRRRHMARTEHCVQLAVA